MADSNHSEFLIVGAGIAGASAAYFLTLTDAGVTSEGDPGPLSRYASNRGKAAPSVTILEREAHPGYHSTGRSAAAYFESYGSPQIRALTLASRAFLLHPPAGFSEHPLLKLRGALMLGSQGQQALLDENFDVVRSVSPKARRLSTAQTLAMVPALRSDWLIGAVHEPDVFDIDVNAVHQGYLRGARAGGARLQCNAHITHVERYRDEWLLQVEQQRFDAQGKAQRQTHTWRCSVLINAAGAWADQIAALAAQPAIGLTPKRRSAFLFAPPAQYDTSRWPMFLAVDESWYIKPDAGLLLGSPANADPVEPHDVQAEELDVAIGIDRIQTATELAIHRPTRIWAGLRSFVADGGLVIGGAGPQSTFIWLAAQGGYGIQTSAAAGACAAALARGRPLPPAAQQQGLDLAMLSPARLGSGRASDKLPA